MSSFRTPDASRRARQRAVEKARKIMVPVAKVLDPNYEAKKARRKMARTSRRANR